METPRSQTHRHGIVQNTPAHHASDLERRYDRKTDRPL